MVGAISFPLDPTQQVTKSYTGHLRYNTEPQEEGYLLAMDTEANNYSSRSICSFQMLMEESELGVRKQLGQRLWEGHANMYS